jgi:hypothetical protein
MMREDADEQALWARLVESDTAFYKARIELFKNRRELLQESRNITKLVRDGLGKPTERVAALGVAKLLPKAQLKNLLPDLLSLASFSHGLTGSARELILSLPREWTVANIETLAEPILQQGAYEEYQRILELYSALDPALVRSLAQRAIEHADPEVVDVGKDFLASLH